MRLSLQPETQAKRTTYHVGTIIFLCEILAKKPYTHLFRRVEQNSPREETGGVNGKRPLAVDRSNALTKVLVDG